MFDDGALSLTLGARRGEHDEAACVRHVPAATAMRARLGLGTRPGAGPRAVVAGRGCTHANLALDAEGCLTKRDPRLDLETPAPSLPPLLPALLTREAEPAGEHLREEVLHVGEDVA